MQLVIHAPFGGRINRAWGMALRKRFCRSFDFELQAAATDDGDRAVAGAAAQLPARDGVLDAARRRRRGAADPGRAAGADVRDALALERDAVAGAAAHAAAASACRRPCSACARRICSRRCFPAQTACQDNHGGGAIEIPDHPLVRETVRDCLVEAMDAAGLRAVLDGARTTGASRRVGARAPGAVGVRARDPERQPVRVPRRRAAGGAAHARGQRCAAGCPPTVVERIGGLDPAAIDAVVAEAQPDPRDADELHDLLLDLGALPEAIGRGARLGAICSTALVADRRAARLRRASRVHWVAAERRSVAAAVWPERRFVARRGRAAVAPRAAPRRRARARWSRSCAVTSRCWARRRRERSAARLGVRASDVDAALARLEMEGARAARPLPAGRRRRATQWCDRRLLARINRRMLDGLRREIEPVSAADCLRFLFGWQHVRPGTPAARPAGPGARDRAAAGLRGGGRRVGARDPAGARWPATTPAWLDALCLSGGVTWGRLAARARGRHAQPRGADRARPPRRPALAAGARRRSAARRRGAVARRRATCSPSSARAGASFLDEIIAGTRRLRAEVEDALGELVSAGRVTGDGFSGLRALISATQTRGGARARWHARWTGARAGAVGAGRWSLLRAGRTPPLPDGQPASSAWPRRRATRRWPASTSSATASCSATCWRARRRRRRGAIWCASTGASR